MPIEYLFSKFAAAYGHIWRSQFKTDAFTIFAKIEWQDGLSQFSDKTVNEAIEACRRYFEKPPTLAEVVSCCREIQNRFDFEEQCRKKALLPQKKANPEVARFHLERLKKILNMKKEATC